MRIAVSGLTILIVSVNWVSFNAIGCLAMPSIELEAALTVQASSCEVGPLLESTAEQPWTPITKSAKNH